MKIVDEVLYVKAGGPGSGRKPDPSNLTKLADTAGAKADKTKNQDDWYDAYIKHSDAEKAHRVAVTDQTITPEQKALHTQQASYHHGQAFKYGTLNTGLAAPHAGTPRFGFMHFNKK